jgi:CubicO group peptidase (beta-lactamase class C family)
MVSTAMDYSRFLQRLLNDCHLDGQRLLRSKAVARMACDHLRSSMMPNPYYLPGAGFN